MRRDTLVALAVVFFVLAALAAKAIFVSLPPVRNLPGEFNAERAKARLAFILGDQAPHPADSAADDLVRARLVTVLQQMGLAPIVRDQFACNDFQKARLVACARVRNVIAVLGPRAGKALLLSAHYDSVPVGPGASDDGIGVATLLEVGSILKDRPLKRPVMLLFNEGEELGLVGARAFLADPLSKKVDSLLNFEARGVNGPAVMFETSQPNGAAIAVYGASVDRPFASSLSTDIARLIPNDTDVTTYKERGWLTLNTGIVGNETRYHSPGDDLAGLDIRSLQSMGDEALALASTLSDGVPQAKGTRIFFDVLQRTFIEVPLAVGIVWLIVLLAGFGIIAWRRGSVLKGTGVVFASLIAAGLLSWLLVTIVSALRAGVFWRAHPEISYIAIYATALLGELTVLRSLGANLRTEQLRAAYWFLFPLLGGVLALAAPGGIIYFLIPTSVVLIGVVLARWFAPAETICALAGFLLLYLSWSELLGGLEELFTPGPIWIVAPVASIIMAPALIEAHEIFGRVSRRLIVVGTATVTFAAWIVAGAAPAYSQDHQQRFTIEHATPFPSRRSSWSILDDGADLPSALSAMGPWHRGKLDFSDRQRLFAPAPAIAGERPPSLVPLEVVRTGDERRLRLRLQANGAERILLAAPPEAHIRSAGVAGFIRSFESEGSSGRFTVTCTGRSCDGAELQLDLLSAKPVTFTLVGSRNGLPPSAAPLLKARPKFARPQYTPDEIVAVTHVSL